MTPLYTYPQETWNVAECKRKSNHAPKDAWGNRPPKGIIASSASTAPQYGQTIHYNGGKFIDGILYAAVHRPLPNIPPSFEFYQLSSWGTAIREKKQ